MMTRDLAHIAARAFNTPLLIQPRKAEIIASVLAERIGGVSPLVSVADAKAEAEETRAGRSQLLDRFDGERRGPKVVNAWGESFTQTRYLFKDGVALVTVEGTLVNRGAYIGSSSGLTSYEGVMAQLASAAADRDVTQIILDLESPGGEATGAFEMADFVAAVSAQKPVTAVVNGLAASAAYAMASGASRIVTAPSGVAGSIGVVMLHLDRSKQLEKQGVAPTLIYAGGHKVDGNPFAPLPDSVRAEFQAEIDQLYSMFVETVARGRRAMTSDAIRATEAQTYIGAAAVAAGLADDVGTLAEVFDMLKARGGPSRFGTKGSTMSHEQAPPAAETGISQAQLTAAVASARVDGAAAGGEAERARISAILDSEEAKGRESLARHFAFKTGMDAESARAALAASAVAPASAPAASPLSAAMAAQRAAHLGPGGERSPSADAGKVIDAADIYARRAAQSRGR
jgi:capsid assembly protease